MGWKCKEGCTDCCGPVPFPEETVKKHEDKKQREVTEVVSGGGSIYVLTKDVNCVFLSQEGKCVIYEDRPQVCKDYGTIPRLQCPHINMNGNPRSPAKVRRMQRIINHQINDVMKQVSKLGDQR